MSVKGMTDILPDESWKWEKIRSLFLENALRFGYKLISTPIVESADLFIRGIGDGTDIVEKQMYLFNDKKGNALALRPEGTASVVRSFIEHKFDPEMLHKLCYFGAMYRYERPQKGRMRQFHQAGIEAFGSDDPALDAEQIVLADRLIRLFGIKTSKILLNSIGCPSCRPNWQAALISYFKSYSQKLCTDCKRRLYINPLRILDCKVKSCRKIAENAPIVTNHLCNNCNTHHNRLKEYLSELNIQFVDDPKLVRGLDYYTKTVFEITTDEIGAQSALVAGGRYNNLVSSLGGKKTPATGWAMGIERILLLDRFIQTPDETIYFIALGQSSKKELFKLFISVSKQYNSIFDYKGGSLKAQLRRANRINARICVIMGESERSEGNLLVKDMKEKSQRLIKYDELSALMKNLVHKENCCDN